MRLKRGDDMEKTEMGKGNQKGKIFTVVLTIFAFAAILCCILLFLKGTKTIEQKLTLYEGPNSLRESTAEDRVSANEEEHSIALLHSGDTQVKVNGYDCFVYDTTVNNTHTWAANYLPKLSRTPVTYFDFSGSASIEVAVSDLEIKTASVSPISLKIELKIDKRKGKVSFAITEPGSYTVQFNDSPDHAVHIFANAYQENLQQKSIDDLIYIGPGEWNIDRIEVKSGQTLYLSGGAVVHGTVYADNAKDIKVLGNGIIDGSHQPTWKGTAARVPIDFRDCENVTVDGPIILNSNAWNLNLYQVNGGIINNVKIISARPNGDGITLQSCQNIDVKNSFVRSWDDSLVLKNYDASTEGITFRKMTLWTDLAQSMEIGYETNKGSIKDAFMHNILFEDIDVIHALHKPVISIHNADDALISDVIFRNVTVENARMGLGDAGQNNQLIDMHITRNGGWSTTKERGQIRDVIIDGVTVLHGLLSPSRIQGWNEDYTIENVNIKNLTILGKKITSFEQGKFSVHELSTKNITIE